MSKEKREQVIALGRLGWPLRRIEEATGVRRETAGAYLRRAGIATRQVGSWGEKSLAKAATSVATGPLVENGTIEAKPVHEVSTRSAAPEAKAATGVTTGFYAEIARSEPVQASVSACASHRELIEAELRRGRNAMGIWQNLVDGDGFAGGYGSVKRFVRALRGAKSPDARVIIETQPGEEYQVDYGTGPMVRDEETGKYRRTRLFVMTLGYSRKSVRS